MSNIDLDMKILVVDDQITMTRIIKNLLGQLHFTNIDTASDGDHAIAQLRLHRYSLILSDWNMERVSGLSLLKHVRADKDLCDIPFIMITAESKVDNIVAAKESGVSNYIVKPFTAATLQSKIAATFKRR